MSKKSFLMFLALTLVVTFSLTSNSNILQAQAQIEQTQSQIQNEEDFFNRIIGAKDSLSSLTQDVNEKEKNQLLKKTRELLKEGSITNFPEETKAEYKESVVRKYETEDKEIRYIVTVPLHGGKIEKLSTVTIEYDQNINYVDTTEILISDVDETYGNVTVYKLGKKLLDQNINKEEGNEIQASFWSCLNNCLASQGIAGWTITALSIACGLACAGTAGLGCIVCLAALTAGAEWVIANCVYSCS